MKKKYFLIIMILILPIWIISEIAYQYHLRNEYYKNGKFMWEEYAFFRNEEHINKIINYFIMSKDSIFNYDSYIETETLAKIPPTILNEIHKLKFDLLSGVDVLRCRQNVLINKSISISISFGARWHNCENGYDFIVVYPLVKNSGIYNTKIYKEIRPNIFIFKNERREIWLPKYNCNSYDLLICKLERFIFR